MTGRFVFRSDPAHYDVLPHLLRSVIEPGVTWVGEEGFQRIHLAVYELLVNVSRHAYHRRDGMVEMHISINPTSLLVSVFDAGGSYDGELDFPLPAEPRAGGYGLPIIDAVADHLRYRRMGPENHWQLEFLRSRGPVQ